MNNNIYNRNIFSILVYLNETLLIKNSNPNSIEFLLLDYNFFNNEILDKCVQDCILFLYIDDINKNIKLDIEYVRINNYIICRNNRPKELEWLNNDGTFSFEYNSNDPLYRRALYPICETINHPFIIKTIIMETINNFDENKRNYIEYGVSNGYCIREIAKVVNMAYGVDISEYDNRIDNIKYYKMTTNEFSIYHLQNKKYSYAFIDADHTSYQVKIDFDYVFKYLEVGGYIFLHHTYPIHEKYLLPYASNDCYKVPLLIKDEYSKDDRIEILTLPISPGLTIIRKCKD